MLGIFQYANSHRLQYLDFQKYIRKKKKTRENVEAEDDEVEKYHQLVCVRGSITISASTPANRGHFAV